MDKASKAEALTEAAAEKDDPRLGIPHRTEPETRPALAPRSRPRLSVGWSKRGNNSAARTTGDVQQGVIIIRGRSS